MWLIAIFVLEAFSQYGIHAEYVNGSVLVVAAAAKAKDGNINASSVKEIILFMRLQ